LEFIFARILLLTDFLHRKRRLFFVALVALILPVTIFLAFRSQDIRQRADDETIPIDESAVSEISTVDSTDKVVTFAIDANDKKLFNLPSPDEKGINEVLKKSPRKVKRTPKSQNKSSDEGKQVKLIPSNFLDKAKLKAKNEEKPDEKGVTRTHFRYEQTINTIPVYGADLLIHVKNKSEVYAMSGNLVTNESVPSPKISNGDAETKAISKVKEDVPFKGTPKVDANKMVIFNAKVIGVGNDDNNKIAANIIISDPQNPLIKERYS